MCQSGGVRGRGRRSTSRGGLAAACAWAWVAAAVLAGPAATAGADTPPATLRAVGDGVAFVTPDAATVTISVARTGPSAGAARALENARLQAIIAGLRGTGLGAGDIQSSQIGLERRLQAAAGRGRPRRVRWVASGTLTVDTRRVDLLSRIFAAAARAGADSFDGPNYRLSDPAAGKLAAEAAAVRDARRRADGAAAAAGLRVIGVQSIDLDPGSGPILAQNAPVAAARPTAPGPTPIPTPSLAGREEVDATVDVVFLLGP
jgi:uncharacterized protein YggE